MNTPRDHDRDRKHARPHDEGPVPVDPIARTLDEDLVLYHYRDGLSADRVEAITSALHDSPELRARHAELRETLAAADRAPVPVPPPDLEQRLWSRLQARAAADAATPAAALPRGSAPARWRRPRALRTWALAASLVLALGLGIVIGAVLLRPGLPHADPEAGVASTSPAQENVLAPRMLDAYAAAHLRASQGLLLTALNAESDGYAGDGAAIAAALVESNRLYAAAATRAGDARLAALLRQLEPLLIELANPPAGGDIELRKGLRQYVRDSDLLFRLRATEAQLDPRTGRRA